MKFKTKARFSFYYIWIAVWLLASNSVVLGARVAGEKGVTPVTPKAEKEAQRPARAEPPKRAPEQIKPFQGQEQERTIQKQVPKENKEAPGEAQEDKRYVTIDFDNVDIEIFIKFISELTGKNFVIDKAVKGKVTILSPTKISVEEAYRVFESVLEVNGFTTVPAGSITKIVPSAEARAKDIQTNLIKEGITPEDKVVTQLIPLKYADPEELKKLFAPLISKSSVIVSYPPTGMLIVTDVLSNIKRLLHITKVIDVEGIGEEISVLPLKHATASIMAKTLETLFQRTVRRVQKGASAGEDIVKIVADERTNALIILASENDTKKIKQLLELLDKETPRGEGDIRVYYLQNANAEDLAKVLMAIPSKQEKTPVKGQAPVLSKEVQVVADAATNSLVITSNKTDYRVLEEVIKKLDIGRRMVYIEALIMEVSVDKSFKLGVQWEGADDIGSNEGRTIYGYGGTNMGTNAFPSVSTAGVVSLPEGFSLGVLGESIQIGDMKFPNIGAVIHAYQTHSDVHILQTPQIMTTDNEEAEILVAENRPFLTRQERTTSEIDYSNYEFKDVGVTLNITPQINQERFVRLKISQEVSQVVSEATIGLPVTLKRQAKTTVVIKDGHTVVIGGLIDKNLNEDTRQVPYLGSIPVLGWLFKSFSSGEDKTNLFIFLTPHIVENPDEAQEVYQQKKNEIDKVEEGVIKMYKEKQVLPPELDTD
jgi:general secretion pathway protein D